MSFYVYMLKNVGSNIKKTYVGYTINLKKRSMNHNIGKGAKSTKGHKWELLYAEKYETRREAMSREWYLKRDRKFRKNLSR